MGCGNSREKIEDQMMKLKIARIEVQMERYNNLERLKGMDGRKRKAPLIPDYIDPNFINNYFSKKMKSTSNEETLRKKPGRSKSFALKRKTIINEKKTPTRKMSRKGITIKRKTLKI